MDVLLPTQFRRRIETLSTGRTYTFVDELPDDHSARKSSTILCIHGFPDLWYGWRHQIGPWRKAGYRVVVPSMLGYDGTDQPVGVESYGLKSIANDIAALLDLLAVPKAVIAGHDWGAATAWRFALYFPERVLALAAFSFPYVPISTAYRSLEDVVQSYPKFGYQLYFAHEKSTKQIEANLDSFLKLLHRRPGGMTSFMRVGQAERLLTQKPEVLQNQSLLGPEVSMKKIGSNAFSRSGMHGPLSYYRTTKVRYDEEKDSRLPTTLPDFPVLFLWGTKDGACPPHSVAKSRTFIRRLKEIQVENVGHWVMVEASDTVTSEVIRFLKEELPNVEKNAKL